MVSGERVECARRNPAIAQLLSGIQLKTTDVSTCISATRVMRGSRVPDVHLQDMPTKDADQVIKDSAL